MKWTDFAEISVSDDPDGSTWIVMRHAGDWVAWNTRRGVNIVPFGDRESAKKSCENAP